MTTNLLMLLMTVMFTVEGLCNEILIKTNDGEMCVLDVDPTERLNGIQDHIALVTQGKRSSSPMGFGMDEDLRNFYRKEMHNHNPGQFLGYPRNYDVAVKPDEKGDIYFILYTLANKTLISIALHPSLQAEIKAAGVRIDHLHPLRFLMTVFTDEELKVYIRNIRQKGLVWYSFFDGGLKECLTTESAIDNIKPEHVLHFAATLKIPSALIEDSIYSQMWDDFVDILIKLPRSGDYDRYDN